jgi:hypothetical protein
MRTKFIILDLCKSRQVSFSAFLMLERLFSAM